MSSETYTRARSASLTLSMPRKSELQPDGDSILGTGWEGACPTTSELQPALYSALAADPLTQF